MEFDDLMDDFLNPKGSMSEDVRKTIEELSQITDEKELNKRVFEKFGEPTQIVKVVDNGVEVVQFIWKRPEGTFFTTYTNHVQGETHDIDKIWETIYNTISDKAGIVIADYTNKPTQFEDIPEDDLVWLNMQLEEAIEVEDYVRAAQLRDKINAKKNEQPE
jgi:uncharacterized FAD-dependent dehydrogenase